MSNLSASAKIG